MNINLPAPHPKQKEAIYYASQETDYEFVTIVAGRRAGKSACLKQIILYYAFLQPKLSIWYVSYADPQIRDFYFSLVSSISDANIISKTIQSPYYSITFINGSTVYFKSSLAGDSLRGGDGLDALIVDEFAFVKPETFSQIILPQLATKKSKNLKKKVIVASSPRGKTNHLYKYYSFGQSTEPEFSKFASVKFNIFDNPACDYNFVETARLSMNPNQYQQEILGEFTDEGAVFNYINEAAVLTDELIYNSSTNYFLGVDIGLKHDRTVLTVLASKPHTNNEIVQMVEIIILDQPLLSTDVEKRIVELNRKYRFRTIMIECNNSGLPIITNLLNVHKLYNIEGFNTTLKSKSVLINQLSHLFNQKKIEIQKNKLLLEELTDFISKETDTGFIKYEGLKSDDTVMSLAIAVENWLKNKQMGSYIIQRIN